MHTYYILTTEKKLTVGYWLTESQPSIKMVLCAQALSHLPIGLKQQVRGLSNLKISHLTEHVLSSLN